MIKKIFFCGLIFSSLFGSGCKVKHSSHVWTPTCYISQNLVYYNASYNLPTVTCRVENAIPGSLATCSMGLTTNVIGWNSPVTFPSRTISGYVDSSGRATIPMDLSNENGYCRPYLDDYSLYGTQCIVDGRSLDSLSTQYYPCTY